VIVFLLLLLVPLCQVAAAPARISVKDVTDSSSEIIVGKIKSRERVKETDAQFLPNYPFPEKPTHLCRFNVEVDMPVFSSRLKARDSIWIYMFDFFADCRTPGLFERERMNSTFLWFLRYHGKWARTSFDSPPSVLQIGGPGVEAIRHITTFPDKQSRVGYLLLLPGIVSDHKDYASSIYLYDSEVLFMCGMKQYLKIRAAQYQVFQSNELRDQMCLVLSRYGMCVHRAKRAMRHKKSEATAAKFPLLGEGAFERWETTEERLLYELQHNKNHPLFENAVVSRDLLIASSCSTSRKVRRRARDLIQAIGNIEVRSIVCVPCD
jgi:hypothetical protein